jgi:hypothetical protein
MERSRHHRSSATLAYFSHALIAAQCQHAARCPACCLLLRAEKLPVCQGSRKLNNGPGAIQVLWGMPRHRQASDKGGFLCAIMPPSSVVQYIRLLRTRLEGPRDSQPAPNSRCAPLRLHMFHTHPPQREAMQPWKKGVCCGQALGERCCLPATFQLVSNAPSCC